MKVVILCGGYGLRMREVTEHLPKPLAVVGTKPILWYIMKLYARYGHEEFILPLGYMGDKIKEYFMNSSWKQNDFLLDMVCNEYKLIQPEKQENWKIAFIDTGADTMTGGRIKRLQSYIGEDTFLATYGDGLSDVDLGDLVKYHKEMGRIATMTGIQKKSQFGVVRTMDGIATSFGEKSEIEGLINGGYFVFNKEIFDHIPGDGCSLEADTLVKLSREGQLAVYEHNGYWQAIDTAKDIDEINSNWPMVSSVLGI